jgi:hypothetical protein
MAFSKKRIENRKFIMKLLITISAVLAISFSFPSLTTARYEKILQRLRVFLVWDFQQTFSRSLNIFFSTSKSTVTWKRSPTKFISMLKLRELPMEAASSWDCLETLFQRQSKISGNNIALLVLCRMIVRLLILLTDACWMLKMKTELYALVKKARASKASHCITRTRSSTALFLNL